MGILRPGRPVPLSPDQHFAVASSTVAENIRLYQWIEDRFAPGSPEAEAALEMVGPYVRPFVTLGSHALDLCCGAGAWSLWMAELGARVVGVDVATHMIQRAHAEAARRNLSAAFVVGDVSNHDHGADQFDVALLMGNSIADLSHPDFESTVRMVRKALVPGGRFLVHYLDGRRYLADARAEGGGVELETPERITWVFTEHRPEDGCWVATYTNETTGERYEYTTFVHTAESLRAVLEPEFELEESFPVGTRSSFDVWRDRSDQGASPQRTP